MQNARFYTPEARASYERVLPALSSALSTLEGRDRDLFALRFERYFQNLYDGLAPIYGAREDFEDFLLRLLVAMVEAYRARPEPLKLLDLERDLTPDWFQRESMVGYVCYVDRFAGTLEGVLKKVDYLGELGVSYLHLMKVVRTREGENDGGYAVADYRDVDPALGSVAGLEELCTRLRERGISVCIDLVLNHCAREHDWAVRARAGEKRYQDYFYTFPDRELPDAYERTLPEVFPDFAPGNFSYDEDMERWVWTTFNGYQWDLNWSNPKVFLEVAEIMFFWANRGVEVFRLDAVAFLWKRLGTDSQNQTEVYDLLQALRACSKIATAAVAHKAEAIVSPDDLIRYFGVGKHYGKVSNIAYHNSLMVQFWSSLASRDTRLMTRTLAAFPRTPNSIAWGNYLRCHDDIGWAVTDEDAAEVGLSGFGHRSFLSDFYAGAFPGSFAQGAVFQFNPATGDRRISGSFASLAGLERALAAGDEEHLELALERILLGHALICGFGGLPLLYMGDELGLCNDYGYAARPEEAADNRWLHRPPMNWAKAARRFDPGTLEGRLFAGVRRILEARRRLPQMHSGYETEILDLGHPRLFAHLRRHPLGPLLCLYNFSEAPQRLALEALAPHGFHDPAEALRQGPAPLREGWLELEPYDRLWLV